MVLWQHVVLCKGTLLRMCLTVGVRSVLRCVIPASLSQRNTLRTPTVRRILNHVPLHNTTCCHSTVLVQGIN